MKIAIAQINTTIGDLKGNSAKMMRAIVKAKAQKCDLVCFSEMTLVGYPPRDLLERPSFIDAATQAMAKIAKPCKGIAAVVGSVARNPYDVGKPLYNAAYWLENGQISFVAHKSLLPSYDVFDEVRYFEPGHDAFVIPFRGKQIGLTICEDIWNQAEDATRRYADDPVENLVAKGCDFLINLSASPYRVDKFDRRYQLVSGMAARHHMPVVYVNQVGGNDELIFDGGSMVVKANGELVARAPFFKEGLTVVDLNGKPSQLKPFPDRLQLLEQALVCGLKDYVKKCGFKQVVLGLSGGVDSSLVAYLAVKALGPDKVFGLIMPSRYSSAGSKSDAKKLAKNLKMKVKEVPINSIHKAFEKSFDKMLGRSKAGTTNENIQARIRGNLVMAVSNKHGHLVLTTGNKSEVAVGYTTLYGDMSGGLAVISDVPKTLVYELCHYINRQQEMIPNTVLTKPPSAELRPNQTDQDSLPPYDELDAIVKAYIEDFRSVKEIIKAGHRPATVKRVTQLINRNEYKRQQAAPGLRVTSKAFGMGRRFPIACRMEK